MAKAKFKLGSLVRTAATEDQAAEMGRVTGVIQREDGVHYELDNGREEDLEIREDEVEAAFREIKPRESKPRAVKSPRKSEKKAA